MPEAVEEKKESPPPPTPPAASSKADASLNILRLWVALVAFSWAATTYGLLKGWFWSQAAEVGPIKPALGIAALLGAAIFAVCEWKFRARYAWYKPGQGRWVRACAFASVGALTIFAAFTFYQNAAPTTSWWWGDLGRVEVFGKALSLKPVLFPAAGIFSTIMFVTYLLLNQDRWSEFMIETEGELKKVAWPQRRDYLGSAAVVVVVVAVVSFFLHLVDAGLSRLMQRLGIGF